ncbi:MAG: hypothetical protein ACP5J4_18745 [Anaerolineae bacterium]
MKSELVDNSEEENEASSQNGDGAMESHPPFGFRGCVWWVVTPSMAILFLVLPLLDINPLYALLPLLIPASAIVAVIVTFLIALLFGRAKLRIRRH